MIEWFIVFAINGIQLNTFKAAANRGQKIRKMPSRCNHNKVIFSVKNDKEDQCTESKNRKLFNPHHLSECKCWSGNVAAEKTVIPTAIRR